VLKASGRVVVVTPNAQSLGRVQFGKTWRGWEPPRHLFLFTPKTLRTCAERAGLRIVTLRTTARLLPIIWMASSSLRSKQLASKTRDRRSGWATQIWMTVMGLHEHFFGRRRAAGEEVVLMATKD
jgi:hypothetical protein